MSSEYSALKDFAAEVARQSSGGSKRVVMATAKSGSTVQIDGSSVVTPVSTTSSMKAGDRVLVTVEDHKATVTGNVTAPSTDDTVANEALEMAEGAAGVSNYFWHDSEGAHVSAQERSTSGIHTLINSIGYYIKRGASALAKFVRHDDGWIVNVNEPWVEVSAEGDNLGLMSPDGKSTVVGSRDGSDNMSYAFFNGISASMAVETEDNTSSYCLAFYAGSGYGAIYANDPSAENGGEFNIHTGLLDVDANTDFNGKYIYGAKNMFGYTNVNLVTSVSISAGGYTSGDAKGTASGWYPIAVVGINSGTRFFTTTRCYISSASSGNVTISYMISNWDKSESHSASVTARVLWVRS